MTMSVIGPTNNIWGPGLAFEMQTDGQQTPIATDQTFRVFFTTTAGESTFDTVAEASSFVRSDGTSTLIVGQGVITQQGHYRAGQSAGGEVFVQLHRMNVASQDLEPPIRVGPVSWDPSLQLFKLLGTGGGGGLTPDQAQQLAEIHAAVITTYKNQP